MKKKIDILNLSLSKINTITSKQIEELNSKQIYRIKDILFFYPKNYNFTIFLEGVITNKLISILDPRFRISLEVIFAKKKLFKTKKNQRIIFFAEGKVLTSQQNIICCWFNNNFINDKLLLDRPYVISFSKASIRNNILYINMPNFYASNIASTQEYDINITPNYKYFSLNTMFSVLEKVNNYILKYRNVESAFDLNLLKTVHMGNVSIKKLIENKTILDIQKILWILSITKGYNYLPSPSELLISTIHKQCLDVGKKMLLTPRKDQIESCINICNDILKDRSVVLIGDTGSGKTFVSICVTSFLLDCNKKIGIMAPTTILSRQLYDVFYSVFGEKVILLGKDTVSSDVRVIVSTSKILFNMSDIDVLIVDEEQKFGVKQKELYHTDKPILKMSATPIPRTIEEIKYGKISSYRIASIDRKIETHIMSFDINIIINLCISTKEKILIITRTLNYGKYSLVNILEQLKQFSPLVIHGKLSSKIQNSTLDKFRNGNNNICIATSIIEIGIDMPDIRYICIVDPLFGISQLHQFRGRLSRDGKEGKLFLLVDKNTTKESMNRLKTFTEIESGYMLSMFDKERRGGGNVLSNVQSGHIHNISEQCFDLANTIFDSYTVIKKKRLNVIAKIIFGDDI